jgi:hypothetical protein
VATLAAKGAHIEASVFRHDLDETVDQALIQ